jgi:hypothetical protein
MTNFILGVIVGYIIAVWVPMRAAYLIGKAGGISLGSIMTARIFIKLGKG